VLRKQTGGYLNPKLVNAFVARQCLQECNIYYQNRVFVAVDPPSHRRSRFGLAAMIYGPRGEVIVLGLAECSTSRAETVQMLSQLGMFLTLLRKHPWVRNRHIVPIIEVLCGMIWDAMI